MRTSLFTIIVLLGSLSASAQLRFDYPITVLEPAKLIVSYSMLYWRDSLNPDFVNQAVMLLFVGESSSKFLGKNAYRNDTIMKKVTNIAEFQEHLMNPNKPFPRIGYKVFKNYPQGKLSFIDHIPSNTYKFEENLDMFNWHLPGDTATLKGYKVQKATCTFGGRSWVAWFAPEIPYSDGPYKFNGLPGLILEISDTQQHYVFELISIEKPENEVMIEIEEKDFVEVTKQDYFKAKDAFYSNIIIHARDAGLSDEAQQGAMRSVVERNNPIELIRK
jgi:GLPGLI family protein